MQIVPVFQFANGWRAFHFIFSETPWKPVSHTCSFLFPYPNFHYSFAKFVLMRKITKFVGKMQHLELQNKLFYFVRGRRIKQEPCTIILKRIFWYQKYFARDFPCSQTGRNETIFCSNIMQNIRFRFQRRMKR